MFTKDELKAMLPKVGDKRTEKPTACRVPGVPVKKQPCVVIEVNQEHLWYRVRFEWGGIECYKLPETKPLSWEVGG
jgi:hypothetical protein